VTSCFFNGFRSAVRHFRRRQDGTTAILFGLMVIPILGAIAVAVDYSSARSEKAIQQAAADSAALAAAGKASISDLTTAQLITLAKAQFQSNYLELGGAANPPVPSVSIVNGVVTVSFSRQVDTAILGVFGFDTLDIATTSKAAIKKPLKLEAALVLDYSGSMNGSGKYQAMRDAAVDLVENLTGELNDPGHKFALVPFSGHIYVTLPSDYVVGQATGGTWTNCTKDRVWPYNTEETTPYVNDDETKWISSAPEDNGGTGSGPCDEYVLRNLTVKALTAEKSQIVTQLQAMTPYSMTHISLGLEMGWHVLSPNLPFDEGVAYDSPDVQKVVVLLSDGVQTVGGNGPGGGNSVGAAQDNFEVICDSVKADGIKVVTIGFGLSTQAAKDPLIYCASTPDDFYDASNNSELAASFQAITQSLAGEVRLIQ
jgi:Flp pilus assembly protein TadG